MVELTQDELNFLEQNQQILSGTSLDQTSTSEEEEEPSIDPELQDLLDRNPNIDLSGTSLDPTNTKTVVGGQISTDVTDQVRAVDDVRDANTYDSLYPNYPNFPLGAKLKSEIEIQSEDGSPTESQQALIDYEKALAEWNAKAEERYNNTGFLDPNGRRYYLKMIPTGTDANGVTTYTEQYTIIPAPTGSSSSYDLGRVLEQAGRDVYQQIGGFITEAKILKESELERRIADFDLSGGEQFFSTMLGVIAPAVPVIKGAKYTGKIIKGAELGTKGAITTDAAASAAVEAIMSREADTGLLIRPELLRNRFIDEQGAKDLSMFLDGMFLNGSLDFLIAGLGRGFTFGLSKVSATKKLADREALRKSVTDDTMKSVLEYLDPKLATVGADEAKRRIYLLSEKLNDASLIDLALGKASTTIQADSTTAMLRASEAFVREADQNLLNTMTKAEFDEYVADEAARMSSAMIALMRNQSVNPAVQEATTKTSTQIGEFLQDAAEANLPPNQTVDSAAQTAASNIVRNVDEEVAELTTKADELSRQTDEILSAVSTVVEDNPVVADIVGTGSAFTTDLSSYRKAVNDIFTGDVYKEFKQTFDEVNRKYLNLPEAEIDAGLLKENLQTVIRASNEMDGSGARAASILRDILAPFNAKKVASDTVEPEQLPFGFRYGDDAAQTETAEQILERVTNDIKFKDLYEIKANMASVIDRYRNEPAVMQRLIAFRNHITDAENGQIAFIKSTQPEVADQFTEADAFFKEAKAKFSNSDPVRQLELKLQEQAKFDTETGTIPGPFGRGEPDVIMGSNQFANQVVGDATGTLNAQVKYMLDGIRSPEDIDGVFGDLFAAQAAQDLRQQILNAGDNAQLETLISNAYLPYREKLQSVGATELLSKVDEAFNQVRDARLGLGDIKLFNDTAIQNIDAQIKQAQEGIVGRLISPEKGTPRGLDAEGPSRLVPISDAKNELAAIITGKDSVNKINTLKNRINQLPEVQRQQAIEALQAVSLDVVGSKIFGATPVGTQARNINLGTVARLSADETSNLMKSIDALYSGSETPLMREMVFKTLNDVYESSIPSRMKVNQAGSDTFVNLARNSDMRDAASTAILVFAGYMNPTAALLRRLSSVPIAEAERLQKEISANVLAVVVTNPKMFSEYAKAYADGQPKSKLRELAEAAISATQRTGRYELRVQEQDEFGPEDAFLYDRDMMQAIGLVQ